MLTMENLQKMIERLDSAANNIHDHKGWSYDLHVELDNAPDHIRDRAQEIVKKLTAKSMSTLNQIYDAKNILEGWLHLKIHGRQIPNDEIGIKSDYIDKILKEAMDMYNYVVMGNQQILRMLDDGW